MTQRRDLHRAYAQLTARERVIAELEAYKGGRRPDPGIRTTMPFEQVAEFNRLLRRLDRLDEIGRAWVLALTRCVAELEAVCGWDVSLRLIALRLEPVWAALFTWPEPVTEREYAQRRETARREELSLTEAATIAADDGQLDEAGAEVWEAHAAKARRTIRQALRAGSLAAASRSRSPRIRAGALYDWLGREVPVFPDHGLHLAVRPDAEAAVVADQRRVQAGAWQAVAALHALLDPRAPEDAAGGTAPAPEAPLRGLAGAVTRRLIDGIRETWQEARALEIEAAAVAEELGCKDALLPDLRALLEDGRTRLRRLAEGLYMEEIGELPEPDEECLARVTRLFRPDAP